MSSWLSPVVRVLDEANTPVQVFFRDDDAGWENSRLYHFLDVFADAKMPIDLAVIPTAIDSHLASDLLKRHKQQDLIGLHQHGYSHSNHEAPDSRKCEFGNNRPLSDQINDLANGQEKLLALLGDALDPIFTPPWNRCNQDTISCLETLGLAAISRNVTATPLTSTRLKHIPVHIDWSRIIKTTADPLALLGETLAAQFASGTQIGIMFHHADMGAAQLKVLNELLVMLSGHKHLKAILLKETLE